MQLVKFFIALIAIASAECAIATKDPNFAAGRTVMVHLFEWKWIDIAAECERFLGPKGYGGVQVSPVTENVMTDGRPWHERYQPISYKLITRSGNETEFADMVRRCNAVGVRIYVDLVINHMTGTHEKNVGTGGSTADPGKRHYPAVPFVDDHFNSPICAIHDYNDAVKVRNCEMVGLKDLNQTVPYVRKKIIDLMDVLIGHGVAGFRIDATKHMWPDDLKFIYDSVKNLNPKHGFKPNARPYIAQEVIDYGHGAIRRSEYTPLGAVTEFRFPNDIGRVFRGQVELQYLRNWGTGWSFVEGSDALVFVDNHDNQRERNPNILSYRHGKDYRMALAWALAHPYGNVRLMSSYDFKFRDQGPPHDDNFNILSPIINPNGTCGNGWVCEHRWPTTVNMADFRNVADGAAISMWYDNGYNQVAFSRGNRTFIAFNRQHDDFDMTLQTHLPSGTYCDIISGKRVDNSCTGSSVHVNEDGNAHFLLPANSTESVLAIHVGSNSKLS